MDEDQVFRLAVVVIIAVFSPFAVYRRIRSWTSEPLDRWQEGVVILFGLRLSGFPTFLGCLAWLIDPSLMAWSAMDLPIWLRGLGVATAVCAGCLLTWTFQSLGKNLTDTVVTRQEHTLVMTGPYRYVRHPFYLTFLLGLVGFGLAMANWFVLMTGCIPFGLIVARTSIEERKLVDRFGENYREYMQRVGRFLPHLW